MCRVITLKIARIRVYEGRKRLLGGSQVQVCDRSTILRDHGTSLLLDSSLSLDFSRRIQSSDIENAWAFQASYVFRVLRVMQDFLHQQGSSAQSPEYRVSCVEAGNRRSKIAKICTRSQA